MFPHREESVGKEFLKKWKTIIFEILRVGRKILRSD